MNVATSPYSNWLMLGLSHQAGSVTARLLHGLVHAWGLAATAGCQLPCCRVVGSYSQLLPIHLITCMRLSQLLCAGGHVATAVTSRTKVVMSCRLTLADCKH